MKKLTLLICVLAILLSLTGVASAAPPKPKKNTFSITGYTVDYELLRLLPDTRQIEFHLMAAGAPGPLCAYLYGEPDVCGVSGYFEGTFIFEEWGIVDLYPICDWPFLECLDPAGFPIMKGSGQGTNEGTLTITEGSNLDEVIVIDFAGRANSQRVKGDWVLNGSGIQGSGRYKGNVGLVFTVEFKGRFTDSD